MPAITKKPDLDDATIQIARQLLNTRPKPHDEMKLGKSRGTRPAKAKRKKAKPSR